MATTRQRCTCPERLQEGLRGECAACRAWKLLARQRRHTEPQEETPHHAPGRPGRMLARLPIHHAAILRALQDDMPYSAIARMCGVGEWTMVQYLQQTGLYQPRKATRAAEITAAIPRILAGWQQGQQLRAIARAVGVSEHTVRRVIHGTRQATPETLQHATKP